MLCCRIMNEDIGWEMCTQGDVSNIINSVITINWHVKCYGNCPFDFFCFLISIGRYLRVYIIYITINNRFTML